MKKYKISAVNYINTFPFIDGLKAFENQLNIEISLDYPARCAEKLMNDQVDIGLIPVAAIPRLKYHQIISDYCIGAKEKVYTVSLFSHVPKERLERILLDYQSKTSVALVQVLARNYWHIQPDFLQGDTNYIDNILGNTGGVIIGDRVFGIHDHFPYHYDLAEEWYQWQQKPFCFAAWTANKEIDPDFVAVFNKALAYGVQRIEQTIEKKQSLYPKVSLKDYYFNNISYNLNTERRESISLFWDYLQQLEINVK